MAGGLIRPKTLMSHEKLCPFIAAFAAMNGQLMAGERTEFFESYPSLKFGCPILSRTMRKGGKTTNPMRAKSERLAAPQVPP